MKYIKKTGLILMAVIAMLLTVVAAQAAPLAITVDRVEIDDIEIFANQANRLDTLNDQKVMVEVVMTALQDIDDVEIKVFVSGFEFNDVHEISDSTHVFDADADVTYVKRLYLTFPDLVEEDDYKLRLLITDRNNDEISLKYNLKLDVPRHKLSVEDVVFFPGHSVMAGQALLASVRLENHGENNEDDVRVNVVIPQLSISASDYINEIESTEEEETEEIFLRVPVCAPEGIYPVIIEAIYDQGFERIQAQTQLSVAKNPSCEESKEETAVVVEPTAPVEPVEPEELEKETKDYSSLRKGLEIAFLTLVVLLILVGLIIAFSRRRNEEFF